MDMLFIKSPFNPPSIVCQIVLILLVHVMCLLFFILFSYHYFVVIEKNTCLVLIIVILPNTYCLPHNNTHFYRITNRKVSQVDFIKIKNNNNKLRSRMIRF